MIEVHLTGVIGKAPELKGEGDKAYSIIRLATKKWVGEGKGDKDKDGNVSAHKTTWIDVIVFKGQAKFIVDRASVGDTLVVEKGELDLSTYEKKDKDGNVIDPYAVGVRVRANEIAGPFRMVSKANGQDSSNAGNGNSNGQARTAAPAQQRPANGNARAAAAPARAAAPPAGPAPADDDIPF